MKFDKNNIVAAQYVEGDDILEIRKPLAESKKDEELDEFITDDFASGFLCACAFLACPDEAGTKGFTLKEFIRNRKRASDIDKVMSGLIGLAGIRLM